MRNLKQPTIETLHQFHDHAGHLWCAQLYYPNGKRDPRYWIGTVSMIGKNITIPCSNMAQLWHEVNIRRQDDLFGDNCPH